MADGAVADYLRLGLRLGRHIEGLVDAYYGPPALAAAVAAEPTVAPGALAAEARRLLAELESGAPLDHRGGGDAPGRRRWLRAQILGLLTTARRLAGEPISYAEEVEGCYGVRPRPIGEDEVAEAHRRLGDVLGGAGSLAERMVAWREAQNVPADRLEPAVRSLAEDLRERTGRLFGLPDGERVDFEFVTGQPWSGFNTYHGALRSTVAVNTDLPVSSTSLGHLVAHEAYPGHHTEHCRKEVGLVRRRRQLEETVFLVGTPQCLMAEGLADLGLEVVLGPRPEPVLAEHLRPLGVPYDAETSARLAEVTPVLQAVRANAAWRLHQDHADPDVVTAELARMALLAPARAAKQVEFLMHPTWRAYITCYVEGVERCRRFVAGDPARFSRLLTEQLTPADLVA